MLVPTPIPAKSSLHFSHEIAVCYAMIAPRWCIWRQIVAIGLLKLFGSFVDVLHRRVEEELDLVLSIGVHELFDVDLFFNEHVLEKAH